MATGFPLPWEKVPQKLRKWQLSRIFTVFTAVTKGRLGYKRVEVIDTTWPTGMHVNGRRAAAVNLHFIRDGMIDYFDDDRWLTAAAPSVLWIPAGQAFSWRCGHGEVQRTTVHLRTQTWAPANDADAESLGMLHQLSTWSRQNGPVLPLHRHYPAAVTPRTAGTGRTVRTARTTVSVQRSEIWRQSHLGIFTSRSGNNARARGHYLTGCRTRRRPHRTGPASPERPAVFHPNRPQRCRHGNAGGYRPSRFHALFQQATGVTPQRYLTERRLAHACSLLAHSNDRVIDISLACGFNSQSRFYHAFTTIIGISPARWRRQQFEWLAP